MNYCYGKRVQKSVLCWEVVPISEGPISEVPLYSHAFYQLTFLLQGTYFISFLFILLHHFHAVILGFIHFPNLLILLQMSVLFCPRYKHHTMAVMYTKQHLLTCLVQPFSQYIVVLSSEPPHVQRGAQRFASGYSTLYIVSVWHHAMKKSPFNVIFIDCMLFSKSGSFCLFNGCLLLQSVAFNFIVFNLLLICWRDITLVQQAHDSNQQGGSVH